jgi:hypothetical protein
MQTLALQQPGSTKHIDHYQMAMKEDAIFWGLQIYNDDDQPPKPKFKNKYIAPRIGP